MLTALGQSSDCGTVITSLTAMAVITVMMWVFAANQVVCIRMAVSFYTSYESIQFWNLLIEAYIR